MREDIIGLQGCEGPGISSSLCQHQRGLDDQTHDVVSFPKPTCSQGQKQTSSARILEGQQKGVGNSYNLYGLVPQLFCPSSGEVPSRQEPLFQSSPAGRQYSWPSRAAEVGSRQCRGHLPATQYHLPNPTTRPTLISTFKTYYTRHTFCRIMDAMEFNFALTVVECSKDFNIVRCISAIKDSLDEVKASTINTCWHNLWPQAVNIFKDIPDNTEERRKIAGFAWEVEGRLRGYGVGRIVAAHCLAW